MFWKEKEPDEAAVRKAMKRLRRDKDQEESDAIRDFSLRITGGLGVILLALHVIIFIVILGIVGGAVGQWLKVGVFGSFALGLIPSIAWWRWEFRRRHPVLVIPIGYVAAILLAWVFLQL